MENEKREPSITGEEIHLRVSRRLEKYHQGTLFDQFAMFMGTSQILELGLKNLLANKYDVGIEETGRWTLGNAKDKLKKCGLRPDFIALLEKVIEFRNYAAHELLADWALMSTLFGGVSDRLEKKGLRHGIYDLEQVVVLFDWCQEHNAWD